MGHVGGIVHYLENRPTVMLLLIILFGFVFRISLLFPSWRDGIPSGYDTYIHAASAYFIATGGLQASPTSPIYTPVFSILVAIIYQLTGIQPIYLVVPIAVVIDVLCIIPMFHITRRISGNNNTMGFLGAFFTAINPISITLLVLGSFPSMFAILGLLTIISILVSDMGERPAGIVLMGLLGAFIFLTNILTAAFYILLITMVFFHEVVFRKISGLIKPLIFSLIITIPIAGIYYVPRISYFYVGLLGGMEYILWVLPPLIITMIALIPLLILFKSGLKEKYIPRKAQHLRLLEIWYLTTPMMALIFIWQVAVLSRLWYFVTFPAIVVLAIVFVTKFRLMRKIRKPVTVKAAAGALLITCVVGSYIGGYYCFNEFYSLTPDRVQLINWIETSTPMTATFCAEEEFLPTHLGWYIMGLTGRMSYESILYFAGPFEVGTDVALHLELAKNITTLEATSQYWLQAVKDLHVTFVILLSSKNHTNYASIHDEIVFTNTEYTVYNVSQYSS